jgi:hypothetical protein
MTLDVDVVIVAMMALMVLFLVAGAEAIWMRRGRRAMAAERRPMSGTERVTAAVHHARCPPVGRQSSVAHGVEKGIIKIVAVYRTDPVMVVGETADGALLERSLYELADRPELLPPRLWQELVERYQVLQIR